MTLYTSVRRKKFHGVVGIVNLIVALPVQVADAGRIMGKRYMEWPMEEAMKMFPDGCESFGYSLGAFIDFCEKNNL